MFIQKSDIYARKNIAIFFWKTFLPKNMLVHELTYVFLYYFMDISMVLLHYFK